jgi:hypothetical protein
MFHHIIGVKVENVFKNTHSIYHIMGGLLMKKWKTTLSIGLSILTALATAPFSFADSSGTTTDINLAQGHSYKVTSTIVDSTFHGMETDGWPDDGTKLTDGVIGPNSWKRNDPYWVAYLRQDNRQIVVDLGQEQTVHKLDAWFLQDRDSGIYFPQEVSFEISDNGESWSKVGSAQPQIPISDPTKTVQDYSVDHLNYTARYVRYSFHADVFIFLSELQAWGLPGKQPGAQHAKPTPREKPEHLNYPLAGSKAAGGKKAEVLIPNGYYPTPGIGKWTVDDFIPYVAYVDKDQHIQDYMFDSFQMDSYGPAPSGKQYGKNAIKSDWQYYADQLFQTNLQLGALDQAVAKVKDQLSNREVEESGNHEGHSRKDYQARVVIGIPYPGINSDWGDGLDFNPASVGAEQSLANRTKAVQWYVDYVTSKWEAAGYKNLVLSGFYWTNESVVYQNSTNEEKIIKATADIVHHAGPYTFDWIPYVQASGFNKWQELGFDTAQMQPNYAFDAKLPQDRLENNAYLARKYGLGVEMEMHWYVTRTDSLGETYRKVYYDYLDAAYKYHYQNSFMSWHQNTDTLKVAARSANPDIREMYDQAYKFIKGTYKPTFRPSSQDQDQKAAHATDSQ